ncbi:MAG: glycosyltransferase [Candidatus Omnitrophica bacterium]|nr:glycosyltransferase [Candidatus Omnitrophota bacterium]
MSGKRKFLIVMNGEDSKGCITGGTRITIETAKVMRKKGYFDFMTLCSQEGMTISKRCGLDNECLMWKTGIFTWSNQFLFFLGSLIMPLAALWRSRDRLTRDMIVWSQSDFLHDVLPAFFIKLLNRDSVWLASFYMIAPNPFRGYKFYWSGKTRVSLPDARLAIYWLSQRTSLFFVRTLADRILSANESDKARLAALGIKKDRILPIGGGVELETIEKTPADKEVDFDAVFMGRMHPQKGIAELVDIWRMVVDELPRARLAVISIIDNDYARNVVAKIKAGGLEDNIKITGYIDFERKYAFLKGCKVYITAEMYHDGGLAMLEAMACGLPVISFDSPVIRAMLPEGRFEVPLNDLKAFGEAAISFLKDSGLRDRYAALAKRAIKGWDWGQRAQMVYDFVADVGKS